MGRTGGIPASRPELTPTEAIPEADRDADIAALRRKIEAVLCRVADAIDNAPDGHVISGSERPVFDQFATLKQNAFRVPRPGRADDLGGARKMAGRLDCGGTQFDRTAENPKHAMHVTGEDPGGAGNGGGRWGWRRQG